MGKHHLSRKAKKRGAEAAVTALAAVLVLLVILAGTVIGKYQHQFSSEGSARAQEFYFVSDFLDGGVHTLAAGSTEVTFTLGNHADELRTSEMDIQYVVTVNNGATVRYDNPNQKLAMNNKQDDKVTIENLKPGTYVVTATGTGGYEKTLKATIVVQSPESVVYKYLDTSSGYVLLTVWARGYTGNVTIDPPSGLIPDNTDPVMENVKTGESFTDTTSFSSSKYCSHTYRFFGSGVTAGSFTVTYGDGKSATVKQPS